ncbi:transmembrane protein 258 isoform X2 [Thalassophryne amazonica]|uniref:transmembrane protein 258 isoform X2 n=1 Tax=Thalassophryne amazonica TaxID=390379 RepID=UPI001470B02F|nr:transmembrane protein 258 isoform X2 [Thalassophryne amazonica]
MPTSQTRETNILLVIKTSRNKPEVEISSSTWPFFPRPTEAAASLRDKMELEAMTRYTSPVNPAVFPHLTVVLLAIGMFFTAWFFVYPKELDYNEGKW